MGKIKVFVLLVVCIICYGCKSDDEVIDDITDPQTEIFNLQTSSNIVLPYELVIISSRDKVFNKNSYKAKFGNIDVTLYTNIEGNLVFTIPDVSIGNYELNLSINNKFGKLNFRLNENDITDVDTLLSNELIEPLKLIKENVDALIQEENISEENLSQLSLTSLLLTNFLNQFNLISSSDKKEVAKFYNANKIFTDGYGLAVNKMDGNADFDCFKKNSSRIVLTTASIIYFSVKVLPMLVTPIGPITAFVGLVVVVYGAATIISATHENLLNCIIPSMNYFEDSDGSIDNFTFNSNSFKLLDIKTRVRALISSDKNNTNFIVSNVVSKINSVSDKWKGVKSGLNSIIADTTSWFNGWFVNSIDLYPITYEFVELPDITQESIIEGKNAFVTIDGLPSDVSIELQTSGENGYNIKFIVDEATLPRNFTVKVKYNDGDFQTSDEFTVIIEKSIVIDLIGDWKLLVSQASCGGIFQSVNTLEYDVFIDGGKVTFGMFPIESSSLDFDQSTGNLTFEAKSVVDVHNIVSCTGANPPNTFDVFGSSDTIKFNGKLVDVEFFGSFSLNAVADCPSHNFSCSSSNARLVRN